MGQVPSVDAIKQVALVDVPAVNLAKLEVKPLFSAVGYKLCPVKLTKTSGRHPKTGKSWHMHGKYSDHLVNWAPNQALEVSCEQGLK